MDLKLCITFEYVKQLLNLFKYTESTTLAPACPCDLSKPYHLLNIPDKEIVPDAKRYEDFGYAIMSYDNLDDLLDEVGSLTCGEMYTTLAVFHNNFNLSEKILQSDINTTLYFGDMP